MLHSHVLPYRLSDPDRMETLVEHRSRFSLEHCELNIFETRTPANDFKLSFGGFAVTSMLRGKKVMHLEGFPDFEYVPGETVLAPHGSEMVIDFPEAQIEKPTQCTALVIDTGYLQKQVNRINEDRYGREYSHEWGLDTAEIFLQNDPELARVSNRLLNTFTSEDPYKDAYADLILQELVLCILRLQHQKKLRKAAAILPNGDPFAAVMQFVQQNLTQDIKVEELCRIAHMSKSSFYRQFVDYAGMTPVQLILEERLRHAKALLRDPDFSIKEIAYDSGFNDPNYFSRIFKKQEGITPGMYRKVNVGKLLKEVNPLTH